MKTTLIFVYNASTGVLDKYLDAIHKIISPKTYSCDLCSLTHNVFSEKTAWKNFRQYASFDSIFMYKDQFINTYSDYSDIDFPVVFTVKEKTMQLLFTADQLGELQNTEDLIASILDKIDAN
ncbi:GTPase [Aquimarina sp. 2201CG1-2-11]|uniref:GTPase n=1 Tax=Aquimarina discodermiae TaxID=3231043 RepID=UPI00346324B5